MASGQMSATSKVVLCGDTAVGKTTILNCILQKDVTVPPGETMGVGFASVIYKGNGEDMHINVWDTAGQETYRSLVNVYFKNADVAIFVFDVTSKQSFLDIPTWIEEMNAHCGDEDPEFMLVGNKIDLEGDRQVGPDEGEKFAGDNDMVYIEVSAQANEGIDAMMKEVTDLIRTRASRTKRQEIAAEARREQRHGVDLKGSARESKSCC